MKKTIEYLEKDLKIAKDIGDQRGEEIAYGNLGNGCKSLGDSRKAIEYHEKDLKIAKEIGDQGGEGRAYGNLGIAYNSLADHRKAIEYHEKHFKIAKEIGDQRGKGAAYGSLGIIGQFGKYHNTLCLSPIILHRHCSCFLLGPFLFPRETGKNAYAKYGGASKEYYGIFRSGLLLTGHWVAVEKPLSFMKNI